MRPSLTQAFRTSCSFSRGPDTPASLKFACFSKMENSLHFLLLGTGQAYGTLPSSPAVLL